MNTSIISVCVCIKFNLALFSRLVYSAQVKDEYDSYTVLYAYTYNILETWRSIRLCSKYVVALHSVIHVS